jgi:hypothetical protein
MGAEGIGTRTVRFHVVGELPCCGDVLLAHYFLWRRGHAEAAIQNFVTEVIMLSYPA